MPEQRERLAKLGIKAAELPEPAPAATRTATGPGKGPSKAQQAFERGLAALALWVEREGADRPVPRGAVVEVKREGDAEPVPVRLGVWLSNTRARRDRLNTDQLQALRELGAKWA
ncbi:MULTISPECIES: helicase associated domain-containing protein [Streptomyces]|nr:helicase associated domain-containing protein [Streptomyces sp. BE282]